ncbi:hypothetical protein FOL47_011180 [Perkinsus chesapeaki]|uniref:Cytochrome P450 n=1 Tax=Perkinsus chesapeaki TaxID=330153 RepID=A0A7J6KY56_PERCH|nr:hypothetical protein FOL47_011180 [Perkinsus chesapeaki]
MTSVLIDAQSLLSKYAGKDATIGRIVGKLIVGITVSFATLKAFEALVRVLKAPPFPGPGIPFLIRLAVIPPEQQFKEIIDLPRSFGKICCFKTLTRQVLIVSDIDVYRNVMRRRPREFSGPDFENILDMKTMAMTEGDMWKKHRRISSRPLMESNLDKLTPMMLTLAQQLIQRLRVSANEDRIVKWQPVEDFQICASKAAIAVYMGEENPVNSTAGGETTASAISWLLKNFCIYPEVQRKARAEADAIDDLSTASMRDMPYIEACALESLRLNPSAPVSIIRALVDCTVGGKSIAAGTQIILPIGLMMRQEYEDGDEFK